jgi:hypothetical protein
MAKLVLWLQGKKVYILAILGALVGIINFISTGDFSIAALMGLAKAEWVIALMAAFRAAISKSAPKA